VRTPLIASSDFALESRLVLFPLFAHQFLLMRHRFYILFTCPVFGEYHTRLSRDGESARGGHLDVTVDVTDTNQRRIQRVQQGRVSQ
jgi:hypothetical protein